jgi:hypothetical protein
MNVNGAVRNVSAGQKLRSRPRNFYEATEPWIAILDLPIRRIRHAHSVYSESI